MQGVLPSTGPPGSTAVGLVYATFVMHTITIVFALVAASSHARLSWAMTLLNIHGLYTIVTNGPYEECII